MRPQHGGLIETGYSWWQGDPAFGAWCGGVYGGGAVVRPMVTMTPTVTGQQPPLPCRLASLPRTQAALLAACGGSTAPASTTVVAVDSGDLDGVYRALSLVRLGALLAGADETLKWTRSSTRLPHSGGAGCMSRLRSWKSHEHGYSRRGPTRPSEACP